MRTTAILACALAWIGTASPAWAITDAYVLISTTPDKVSSVMDSQWGFSNCKGLIHKFQGSEIIAHIACNDLASLNKVVSEDIPSKDGVESVTVWLVRP